MNGKGILKKPKTEVESDGEPDIKIEKPNKNISTSGDDDNNNDASTSNYEEQEEALVALIEHRSKEVQHLTNRISYYQTEVFLFFSFISYSCSQITDQGLQELASQIGPNLKILQHLDLNFKK